ncbi:MAG: flagellar biosynthetic protein FliR [Bauldia sp.]
MTFDLGILPGYAVTFMLIFARIGSILMLVPGFGEQAIPARLKVAMGLAITLAFFPLISGQFQVSTQSLGEIGRAIGWELFVGLAIGFALRLLMATLQVAGSTIAMQLNLSFAEAVDPTQSQNSVLVANFLNTAGITLILVTDLHHMALAGLVDSYKLFSPSAAFPIGDFSAMSVQTIAEAFRVGLEISAPFIVFGLIFQFGLGLLSRLMPQMQVFFVATPAAIGIGFVVLLVTLGSVFTLYLGHADTVFSRFLAR